MLTRRQLLLGGVTATIALAAAGAVYEFSAGDEEHAIVAAIAPVMLAGAIPGDPALQRGAVAQVVRGVDVAIRGLPLEVRAQLRQLFGLLRFPPTRTLVAGIRHPWHDARPQEIAQFLASWRNSRTARLRSAYDALHQLLMASWYGNANAWMAIGYAGPPAVG